MLLLRRHPLRNNPTCITDALDIFFLLSFPLLFPKQLLYTRSLVVIPTFCLFFSFIMACFGVILVLVLSFDLAVFLWGWRLNVSAGAKITVLIFIFKDFAFLIGEKFHFAGVCFVLFWCFLCTSLCSLNE